MRVTICQLRNEPDELAQDWPALCCHVQAERSNLVLLPEMPFSPWPFWRRDFDATMWSQGVAAHESWIFRLEELAPAAVALTGPMNDGPRRVNVGLLRETQGGIRRAHVKYYLPDEAGYWEASWYERGDGHFKPVRCGAALLGMLICTEMWFFEHARAYGQKGVHLLVTPRATEFETRDKWLAGGRAAAIVAGAYGLSSNLVNARAQSDLGGTSLGGQGWLISPDGDVLALTDVDRPFVTVEIDPALAEKAKGTYPRYVIAG